MRRVSLARFALVAMTAFLTISGCSKIDQSGKNGDAAAASTLKNVLQSGNLRVGVCLSSAPFGYYDQNNNPIGYDVDLANELAKRMGVKLELVNTRGADRILVLQTNKVDVVFCNFTRNMTRAKEVSFTNPYIVSGQSMIIKKGTNIKVLKDLAGRTVSSSKGSTTGDTLRSLNMGIKIQEYDNSNACILAVKQGQADAMLDDTNFLNYQATLNPDLEVVQNSLVPLEYNGFGVRLGDQLWLSYLNEFLFEINASKLNAQLYKKWFGVDPKFPLNPQY